MSSIGNDEIELSPDLTVDTDALQLLEADLAAKQSVRSVKTPFRLIIEDISNKLFKNRATTLAVFLFMFVCCAISYWNLFMRMPNPEARLTLESENSDMSARLDMLVEKLSEIDRLDLDEKLQVENTRVFNGFPNLAIWINRLMQHGENLNLNIAYTINDASPAPVEDVLNVPIVLRISPVSGYTNAFFKNTMLLISKMLADPWHLDIVSTTARGGATGLAKVDVTIQVWLADSEGYAKLRTDTETTFIADIDSDEEIFQ